MTGRPGSARSAARSFDTTTSLTRLFALPNAVAHPPVVREPVFSGLIFLDSSVPAKARSWASTRRSLFQLLLFARVSTVSRGNRCDCLGFSGTTFACLCDPDALFAMGMHVVVSPRKDVAMKRNR